MPHADRRRRRRGPWTTPCSKPDGHGRPISPRHVGDVRGAGRGLSARAARPTWPRRCGTVASGKARHGGERRSAFRTAATAPRRRRREAAAGAIADRATGNSTWRSHLGPLLLRRRAAACRRRHRRGRRRRTTAPGRREGDSRDLSALIRPDRRCLPDRGGGRGRFREDLRRASACILTARPRDAGGRPHHARHRRRTAGREGFGRHPHLGRCRDVSRRWAAGGSASATLRRSSSWRRKSRRVLDGARRLPSGLKAWPTVECQALEGRVASASSRRLPSEIEGRMPRFA